MENFGNAESKYINKYSSSLYWIFPVHIHAVVLNKVWGQDFVINSKKLAYFGMKVEMEWVCIYLGNYLCNQQKMAWM